MTMASDGETTCTNDPNFAVIYSFLKVFGNLYGLPIPTLIKLQASLENTQEVLDPLKDLHIRLLRRALKSIQRDRWERYLIKFCHQQGCHQEAWEVERFSYKKASTQVKLKILKILLEYQFTCHSKFKSAVNAISCKELRLEPIGKDKNGCAYWLQVDDEANLYLYKEDQDDETWQLVARNREELVKVIGQLKRGEDIGISVEPSVNEDSSSTEIQNKNEVNNEENNEEFLSPESESENESTELKESVHNSEENLKDEKLNEELLVDAVENVTKPETNTETSNDSTENEKEDKLGDGTDVINDKVSNVSLDQNAQTEVVNMETKLNDNENPTEAPESEEKEESDNILTEDLKNDDKSKENENLPQTGDKDLEVSEAIEEPLLIVTGEGNGADCESSYIIGEEISEPVMFFWGEGSGYDNYTGNPDAIEQSSEPEDSPDYTNGEINNSNISSTSNKITKLSSSIKLRSSQVSLNKRALKNQSLDNVDSLKSDPKKHCVRNLVKSDSSISVNTDKNTVTNESSISIDSGKSKVKTKSRRNKKNTRKKKANKVVSSSSFEVDNCRENKSTSIENEVGHCSDIKSTTIEKRKSSVSSTEHEEEANSDRDDKELTSNCEVETKVDDALPLKKLKLEVEDTVEENNIKSNDESNDDHQVQPATEQKLNDVEEQSAKVPSNLKRKTIKARRGKFKQKSAKLKDNNLESNETKDKPEERLVTEKDSNEDSRKTNLKSLKRSLLGPNQSDGKSESQSESEDSEPVLSGKRLKMKSKKIVVTTRKKVEEKLLQKNTSESEEETLYSIAGKKHSKKSHKKKIKSGKVKKEEIKKTGDKESTQDSEITPVRQSRRIAQLKIKEEAERRHMEEVALREMKIKHKKKSTNNDEEEDWKASGCSSNSENEVKKRKERVWRASESTPPPSDSDTDEPLFEHEEPDLEFTKSDHEFSPESDLESGEPIEPLKRARTLQEGADEGYCMRCKSGEQPEWILLCDKCDAGYHASCLKPVLFLVPEGDWFCPPCQHTMLIESLEKELVKYDELLKTVQEEKQKKKLEEPEVKPSEDEKEEKGTKSCHSRKSSSSSESWSSSSEEGAVYRLRERKQLPVSYHAREYDRLISSAIKEEYVEPSSTAGNQGRGKDISTIIEAAEEEKLKAEKEAAEQGKHIERKPKKKQRRKPRKLNSLDVPSEDDDETDEDFKDVGIESSSEDISSDADRDSSTGSRSSDSLPIRRACRSDRRERTKMIESSPEVKKKKGVFTDTSSESSDTKEWNKKIKSKSKPKKKRSRSSTKRSKKRRGLTQYDAEGNVIRARVTYGGLSGDDGENDWSPKHRTRQKKIDYTEMPNTESEDEMHKSSGKHMPDSSDEFRIEESDVTTDSEAERAKKLKSEEAEESKKKALCDLIKMTAVVPLEKLPEDVTRAKTEELQAHLNAQLASEASNTPKPVRGRGSRGGRGSSRGPRGRGGRSGNGRQGEPVDDALSKLVGVKIKDLGQLPEIPKPNQAEKEKKRLEKEARMAEKEARRIERLQKKEEKEKLKEMKAKEREEKRMARLAMQENKRIKKEKQEYTMSVPIQGYMPPVRQALAPDMQRMPNMYHQQGNIPVRHPTDHYPEQRYPSGPRLQVRPELRAMQPDLANVRAPPPHPDRQHAIREGTLSVAGSPQPFKPVSEEPSIITRMPHMMSQQYRGPMMYQPGNAPYGYPPRGPPQNMQMYHPHSLNHPQHVGQQQNYPRGYYPGHGPAGYPGPGGQQSRPVPAIMGPGPPRPGHPGPNHPGGPNLGLPPRASSLPPGMPGSMGGPRVMGPQGMPGPPTHPGNVYRPPHNPDANNLPMPPGKVHEVLPPGRVLMPPGRPPGVPTPGGVHDNGHTPPSTAPQPENAASAASAQFDPNIKIKAEVKTEPEFSRDSNSSPQSDYRSSSPPKDDLPRANHPKIKHTDSKERRPRYPLGPYAPQYGPYGPYAPPTTSTPTPTPEMHHNTMHPLQSTAGGHRLPPPSLHHYHPSVVQNLNSKPPPDQARSPIQRPPSAHAERPPHPVLSPHDMPNSMHPHPSAYPGGMPPHYMHPSLAHPNNQSPHLRPPLRPHYGMPMPHVRHPIPPDRASPSHVRPPHYNHPGIGQHPAELHRMPPSTPPEHHADVQHRPPTHESPVDPSPPPQSTNLTKVENLTATSEEDPPTVKLIKKVEDVQDLEHLSEESEPAEDRPMQTTVLSSVEIAKPIDMPVNENNSLSYIDAESEDKSQDGTDKESEDKSEDALLNNSECAPREEGSVFGGLVSYFSSQQEEDIDA